MAASGSASSCWRDEPELERQRDEPLLRAVVQVALQAPALGQPGLEQPLARALQLVDAGAQLGVEALVVERERGGGADRRDELGLVAQRAVVDERADAAALALDPRRRALGIVVVRAARPRRPSAST